MQESSIRSWISRAQPESVLFRALNNGYESRKWCVFSKNDFLKAGKLPLRIPEAVIAEVRDRTDIVQVIDQYVRLKRTGVNYVGLCPFHDEKTPSFTVSSTRKTFYCFGCHEKGDAIDFIRKMEGKSFVEAVQELASRSGVNIPREDVSPNEVMKLKRRRDAKEKALKINEIAAAFYQKMLMSSQGVAARKYLKSRNLDKSAAEQFRLGYAPDSWDALTSHLREKGVPAYYAERLGLVNMKRQAREHEHNRKNEGENSKSSRRASLSTRTHHDFFRGRLMFPIMGASGEVIGFSGRLLDPDADIRKYVNSPETPVFHKAESLYGVHLARQQMRRSGRAILVEGNLDVVRMHSAGYKETVAPLGTSLTDAHINMLMRFSQKVVLLFDGDKAGKEASRRAARTLVKMGQDGWVAILPDGQDPDTCIVNQGNKKIEIILEEAQPGPDFLIQDLATAAGEEIPNKINALEKIVDFLQTIPDKVAQTLYVDRAAAALDLGRDMVLQTMGRRSKKQDSRKPFSRTGAESKTSSNVGLSRQEQREKSAQRASRRNAVELIALLVSHPHLAPAAAEADVISIIEDPETKSAMETLLDMQESSGTIVLSVLLENLDEKLADQVAKKVFSESFDNEIDAHRALREILTGIKLARIQYEWENLGEEMKKAGQKGDEDLLRELALRRHELSTRRNALIGERVWNQ